MTDTESFEKGVFTSRVKDLYHGIKGTPDEENTMEDETSSNGKEFSPAGEVRYKKDPPAGGGEKSYTEEKDPAGKSNDTGASGGGEDDSNDAKGGGVSGAGPGKGPGGTGTGSGAPPLTPGPTGGTGGPGPLPGGVSDSNLIDEAIRLGLEVQKRIPEGGREKLEAELEADKNRIREEGAAASEENEKHYQNYDRMDEAQAEFRHGQVPEVENETERREEQSKEADALQAEHDALMDDRGGLTPVPNYRNHVTEERMQGWGRALARFGAAGLKQGSNAIDAASKALGEFRKLTRAFLSPNPMSTASQVLASTMIGFSDLYDTIDKAGELAGIKQGADRSIAMETDEGRKYFADKDKAEQATKYLMQTFNDQIAATVGPGGDVSQLTPKEYQRIHETMREALTPMLNEIEKRTAAGIAPTLEERAVVQGWMNLEEGYKKAMRQEQKDLRGIRDRASALDKDVNKLNREVAARDKGHNNIDTWLSNQKYRNLKNYNKEEDAIKKRVSNELRRRERKYLADLKKMEHDLGKQEEYVAAYNDAVATGDTIGALVRLTLDHNAAKAIKGKSGVAVKNTLKTAQDAANARALAAKTPELKELWTNIAKAFGRRIQEINNMGTGQRKVNRSTSKKKSYRSIKISGRKVVTPPTAPGGGNGGGNGGGSGAEVPFTPPETNGKGAETGLGGQVINPVVDPAANPTGEKPIWAEEGWTLLPVGSTYDKGVVDRAHNYLKDTLNIGKFAFGNNTKEFKDAKDAIDKVMEKISLKVWDDEKVDPADIEALNNLHDAIHTMKLGSKKGIKRESFDETLKELKELSEKLTKVKESEEYGLFEPKKKEIKESGGKKDDAKVVDDEFAHLFENDGRVKKPNSDEAKRYLSKKIEEAREFINNSTSPKAKFDKFRALNSLWNNYLKSGLNRSNQANYKNYIDELKEYAPNPKVRTSKPKTTAFKESASFEELLRERIESKFQTRV